MSTITKSLVNIDTQSKDSSLSLETKKESVDKKADSLANSKLEKYSVEFVGDIKSVDISSAWFTNKFNEYDKPMKDKIKHILGLNRKSVKVDYLPLDIIIGEDTKLFNGKTDLYKEARYNSICKEYGITRESDKSKLEKFPYAHKNGNRSNESIRIVGYLADRKLRIAFLDLHHLLATRMIDDKTYLSKQSYCKKCISEIK